MKRTLLALGLILLLASSCEHETIAYFEITNHSSEKIESLSINASGYDNNKAISIEVDEKKEYVMDMSDITASDGEYQLDFKFASGEMESRNFGYYSNGIPLESITRIVIEKDTVSYDSEYEKYSY
jgi:hypothetical protein